MLAIGSKIRIGQATSTIWKVQCQRSSHFSVHRLLRMSTVFPYAASDATSSPSALALQADVNRQFAGFSPELREGFR